MGGGVWPFTSKGERDADAMRRLTAANYEEMRAQRVRGWFWHLIWMTTTLVTTTIVFVVADARYDTPPGDLVTGFFRWLKWWD